MPVSATMPLVIGQSLAWASRVLAMSASASSGEPALSDVTTRVRA